MPSISNQARWYWTQYIEALEATRHGDAEHSTQLCLDLIVQPPLPLLLKALISLHLAASTSTAQYKITHKRYWINQAADILQDLRDRPETLKANIEHLERQLQRATSTVDMQEQAIMEMGQAEGTEGHHERHDVNDLFQVVEEQPRMEDA